MTPETMQFGFIGLGLIGGSIARALKNAYPACRIMAFDPDQTSLNLAVNDCVVDIPLQSIDAHFSEADLIFLCAPVSNNDENLITLKPLLKDTAVLTDVGSVKTGIHEVIKSLGLEKQFIGGHPMAGSERIGYSNSKPELLKNAYYILTPTEKSSSDDLKLLQKCVEDIGAIPLILSCAEHDFATAGISHLPHVVAASLVNLIKTNDGESGIMKMIAAGGFKDITRIASSSPVMWENICMANTENIITLLDRYIESLQVIRGSISSRESNDIFDFFERARDYRESFIDAPRGPIKKSFVLYIDIPDEPGALATIATLLAFRQISIKNIGITHNREMAEGSLQIEFHDEESMLKGRDVLTAKSYLVSIKK